MARFCPSGHPRHLRLYLCIRGPFALAIPNHFLRATRSVGQLCTRHFPGRLFHFPRFAFPRPPSALALRPHGHLPRVVLPCGVPLSLPASLRTPPPRHVVG